MCRHSPSWLPTKFERVLNLKAAKALGLTFAQALRLRANQLIDAAR